MFLFALLIPYFLSSFTRLKEQPEVGVYLVAIPLVTAFTSDAFALFAGMLFGRHKLAPPSPPEDGGGRGGRPCGRGGLHYALRAS